MVNPPKIEGVSKLLDEALSRVRGSPGKSPSFGSFEVFSKEDDPLDVTSRGQLCKAALEAHQHSLNEVDQKDLLATAKKTVLAACRILNSLDFQTTLKQLDESVSDLYLNDVKQFTACTLLHMHRLEGSDAVLTFIEECFSDTSVKSGTSPLQKHALSSYVDHLSSIQDIKALKKVLESRSLPLYAYSYICASYIKALIATNHFPEALGELIGHKGRLLAGQRLNIALTLTENFLHLNDFEKASLSLEIAREALALAESNPVQKASRDLASKHQEYTDALKIYKPQASVPDAVLKAIFNKEEEFKKANASLGIIGFTEKQRAEIDRLSKDYNKAAAQIAHFSAIVRNKRDRLSSFARIYMQVSPIFYASDKEKMQARIDALQAELDSKYPSPVAPAPISVVSPSPPLVIPPSLSVRYDTGWGHALEVRGTAPGMSWDRGLALSWNVGNVWKIDLASLPSEAEYKLVLVLNQGTPEERRVWENFPYNRKASDPLLIDSLSFTF
jgi:hypothetical protein